jgi:hypothetical protein
MQKNCASSQVWDTTLIVTQKANDSMSSALDAMGNQPAIFFQCKCAVQALMNILGVDMLDHLMPQMLDE